MHAAPALDFMRFEIESKKERAYQWVVHHVDKPARVGFEEQEYQEVRGGEMGDHTWSYDSKSRSLQIRATVKAGEDCIVNVSF